MTTPAPSEETTLWDVIIVGAGAAGLFAAAHAAELGHRVLLLEKNRKVGVKILMSGGTRCNLTQSTDRRGIVAAFGEGGPFLHSALARLGPDDVVVWFNQAGVATKVEETGKISPASNSAVDVQQALLRAVRETGVTLLTESPVTRITLGTDPQFIVTTTHGSHRSRQLLITTGGKSYPGCGTTGDGYAWLASLGHRIVRPRPALVPLTAPTGWWTELSGLTLPDVELSAIGAGEGDINHKLGVERGSFLFTHFGYSGPVVLDISRAITSQPHGTKLRLNADWLPQFTEQQLRDDFPRFAREQGSRQIKQWLIELLPKRLVETLLNEARISTDKTFAEFSRTEQQSLLQMLKQSPLPVTGTRGFEKAEVTAGGVALDEVDSRTMQSKLVPGLFLAGEILDLDGKIGGYNFQAAFSTAWLAAEAFTYPE